jgi:hypothetical protein
MDLVTLHDLRSAGIAADLAILVNHGDDIDNVSFVADADGDQITVTATLDDSGRSCAFGLWVGALI